MDRFSEMLERIHNIEVLLDRNTNSLETHMRRTELAEENLELLRKDVRMIEQHVIKVDGVSKFITFICAIVGAVVALSKLL